MTQSIRRLFLAVAIAALVVLPMQAVAQGITSRTAQADIIIVPGTTLLTAPVEDAIRAAFLSAGTRMKLNTYYAPTSQRVNGDWYFISMAGFDRLNAKQSWSLEDGQAWFGLVLVMRSPNGMWSGAVEGTPEYAALLKLVPQSVLSPSARLNLDPAFRQSAAPQVAQQPNHVPILVGGQAGIAQVISMHEGQRHSYPYRHMLPIEAVRHPRRRQASQPCLLGGFTGGVLLAITGKYSLCVYVSGTVTVCIGAGPVTS